MRAEAYVPGGGSWDVWRQALSRNRHDFFTAVRNPRKDTGGLTVARPSWLSVAGRHRDMDAGIFHVFTHCVWAAPALFRDDTDRISFLRELARASTRVEWTCMAYCLMRTHYHLILGVEDGVLPLGMHAVNFRYACAFNKRHDMRGHVQAARYGSRRIGDDAELMHVFRYVARNPVEAGLCADPADWPWSSYASTIGKADPIAFVDPSRIINCFGDTPERAIAALREYVERSADP